MFTIILILCVFIFFALLSYYIYWQDTVKEFKKWCGSIHPVDYLLYTKKRLELKSTECQSYKEMFFLKLRENSLLRKRAESIAKERDEKK